MKILAKNIILPILFFSISHNSFCQFPPAAGMPGTSAMHKDSSVFIDWVSGCDVIRGYQNISNTSAGFTSAGDSAEVFGIAGSNGVVSLGDGGQAVCTFWWPIANGPGFDFAVFENSFDDFFLELAFVEVSNDGITYYRFPATSYTQDTIQVGSFDSLEATKLNNLAGKYRAMYGTPFDLEELNGTPGLDINFINYIKIIDVVGNIDTNYCSYDQFGNKINDPWPTEFPVGGFDLDAIGVINNWVNSVPENNDLTVVNCFPNPVTNQLNFVFPKHKTCFVTVYNVHGVKLIRKDLLHENVMDVSMLGRGIYFLGIEIDGGILNRRIVKE